MPSASENIASASENITSAADNIIRATEDIARATDNIIGQAERQEERNATSARAETRATSVMYSMTEIFDGLLNSFDIQDVEIMISDLSNNLISTPDPQTLFSLVSRFNNNITPR
jgi:hypothetical protein